MSSFWIGITTGLILGAMFGFFLCALLVTAKRADKKAIKTGKDFLRK